MTRAGKDARDTRRAVANILAIYLDAPALTQEAGRQWYAEARAQCVDFARRHRLKADAVAGAAAAISPGLRWESTFAHLAALRRDERAPVPTYCREFVLRALRCFAGEDPRAVLAGPKVTAFYELLAGRNMAAVVIDGHAWNIARGECVTFRDSEDYRAPAAAKLTARRHRVATAAYREAAEVLGEAPHAVQACTWIHWKNIHSQRGREPGED